MIKLRIDGTETPAILVKTAWDEITLGEFFQIQENTKNPFRLLEILCNRAMLAKQWKKLKDAQVSDQVIQAMNFLSVPMNWEAMPVPSYYELGPKIFATGRGLVALPNAYQVPKDLGEETLVQKIVVQRRIAQLHRDERNLEQAIPWALAVYFQPLYDNEDFNEERAGEFMEDVIMHSRAVQAYPIGFFFVRRYIDSMNWKKVEQAMNRPDRRRKRKSERFGKKVRNLLRSTT